MAKTLEPADSGTKSYVDLIEENMRLRNQLQLTQAELATCRRVLQRTEREMRAMEAERNDA